MYANNESVREDIIYEDELETLFMETLKNKYSLVSNELPLRDTFNIFLLRYFIYTDFHNKKIIHNIDKYLYNNLPDIVSFLKRELNLPQTIIYKGQVISNLYGSGNSLLNILSAIIFQYGEKNIVKIENKIIDNIDMVFYQYNELYKKVNKDLKYPKRHKDYPYFVKFTMLYHIYDYYKCVPTNVDYNIDNIDYPYNFEFSCSIDEEILSHVNNSELNKELKLVKEKEVENYFKNNINLIKEGLKVIKTQYKLEYGIIDILAKDDNNTIYIIEVKTKKDKRLLWQVVYYYNSIKKIYHNSDVKFIVVSPKLPEHMVDTLKQSNIDISFFIVDKELLYN